MQITFLYIMSPSTQFCHHCFILLSFSSDRRRRVTNKNMLLLPLTYIYFTDILSHVDLSCYLMSFHVNLKDSLKYFLWSRSASEFFFFFFNLGLSYFSPLFWRIVLSVIELLVDSIFLSALQICLLSKFWLPLVSDDKSVNLLRIPFISWVAFATLILNSLIIVCLSMNSFEFILLGFYSSFWKYRLMIFIKFGVFSAIISYILCDSFSLTSFSWVLIICMLVLLMVPSRSLRFCLWFFVLFSFCSLKWIISADLSLRLSPSTEFFISVTVLFHSRIYI